MKATRHRISYGDGSCGVMLSLSAAQEVSKDG